MYTKMQKLEIANEVYGWYERYMTNPNKLKEPKMPFGVWLLSTISKVQKMEDNH